MRNRFVFQPHFTALGDLDGTPSDAHAAYHEERARGGVGLIVFESQAVHPSGKMSRRFVDAWDPKMIPHHRRVTDGVHAHGAKIFGQLTHGGHTSLEHPPHILWAPTQMPEPSSHFSTKAIDDDDIRAVIDGFAASARNLVESGFDGIEVKVAHDGLLRSFASPFFNHRTDAYGGSFENRLRLSIEVFEAIKQATGNSVPLGVRICVNEFTVFGYDSEYGLQIEEYFQASGLVDYFNSDAGSFSSYWMEIPPAAVALEDFRKINRELKQMSRLPVVAFGRMNSPQLGEEALRAGEADLIGMARQLIADPWTPEKTRRGRAELVRRCIACNDACIFQVGQEKAIRCIQNPGAGRERQVNERLLAPVKVPKSIVVVGGGPAGLKVAETAVRRGHKVTLFERDRALGGQVRLAEKQPEHANVGEVTSYLEIVADEYGVDIRRGHAATPDMIHALNPAIVIVATGSEPNLPRTPGDDVAVSQSLGRQRLRGHDNRSRCRGQRSRVRHAHPVLPARRHQEHRAPLRHVADRNRRPHGDGGAGVQRQRCHRLGQVSAHARRRGSNRRRRLGGAGDWTQIARGSLEVEPQRSRRHRQDRRDSGPHHLHRTHCGRQQPG